MSQLARIIEIDRLVRAGKAPTPSQLKERFGVSLRQIFLDRLYLINELKAPLRHDRARGGWVYTDATWVLPTAIITEGELLAFFLAVEIARNTNNAGLEDALSGAVAKIAQGLGDFVSVDFNALREGISVQGPPAAPVSAYTATQLARAQRARRKVKMLYASASSGQTKWRVVHPYHFYRLRGEWIMLAFDEGRGEVRAFNAHRVQQLHLLRDPFVRDPSFDPEATRRAMLHAELGEQLFECAVWFDPYQARYIRERTFHPEQRVEEAPDGALILRFPASGLNEVARFVLSYGKHARALEPPELVELVADHVRELARVYGGNHD